jgi:hypothetical protein
MEWLLFSTRSENTDADAVICNIRIYICILRILFFTIRIHICITKLLYASARLLRLLLRLLFAIRI